MYNDMASLFLKQSLPLQSRRLVNLGNFDGINFGGVCAGTFRRIRIRAKIASGPECPEEITEEEDDGNGSANRIASTRVPMITVIKIIIIAGIVDINSIGNNR
ncbi:hypothetical protein X798_06294 [Onchocerca flexuosa]|uniref:Uncharacterized protein n=1 Tax=Onchocerca flexuosa TaxID=387005 RepID=A0A238BNX5_9BILA|nr:hypothetical protein X798_06294 [Onchocerca flexuosa]